VLAPSADSWATATDVLVQDGLIGRVGGQMPADVPLIDLGDRSLLPGLIDTHTHVLLQGNRTSEEYAHQILQEEPAHRVVRAVRSMGIALEHGFTTIRDLGTEGAGFADVALRDAAAASIVTGPRMLVAGPAVCSTGSYPILGYRSDWEFPTGVAQCDGVDGCRREVRRQVARGIDWLKIYVSGGRGRHLTEDGYCDSPPVWTEAELRALVDQAHDQGIPVAAHAMSVIGTDMAVAAGVDSVEHGTAIRPETAEAMADRGIVLVPTLLAFHELAGRGDSPAQAGPGLRDSQLLSLANCRRAGVRIVFGTDAGAFDWLATNQVLELGLLAELGLTAGEALRAATVAAAALLRESHHLGEIAEGAAADLIACPGDPLADLAVLRDVDLVLKQGVPIRAPETAAFH